jgi:hypothetical protein
VSRSFARVRMLDVETGRSECADSSVLDLGGWHADPISASDARSLLQDAHRQQQRAIATGSDRLVGSIREMIARFWLDRAIEPHFRNLIKLAADQRARAIVELVYGQLLMSRRLIGAMDHLRNGYAVGSKYLGPAEYFHVMKRHELLTYLPLSPRPSDPMDLASLLREAAVIRELKGRGGRPAPCADQGDTLG